MKNGAMINYLGMSIDFAHSGEARITMAGYVILVDTVIVTKSKAERTITENRSYRMYVRTYVLTYNKIALCHIIVGERKVIVDRKEHEDKRVVLNR